MQKTIAVESLGQHSLMLPAWVKAALAANDRLKVYLTVVQSASTHASHPDRDPPDLSMEFAAAGLNLAWLHDLAARARRFEGNTLIQDLPLLVTCMRADLSTMARPVIGTSPAKDELQRRVQLRLEWLAALPKDRLSGQQVDDLTQGRRGGGDSLHLLVMDLHKQINRLSGELASEVLEGANVWALEPEDRPRVCGFMRGLNRTRPLMFDHPGLDTAATRDGTHLLIQNDIGTHDAHVLVVQVAARAITLTYSDLHPARFAFFQSMLQPFGAKWSAVVSQANEELNRGSAYSVGTAQFDCTDDAAVEAALEGIGSRIVFLIDWNRARKRLLAFVEKADASSILAEVAKLDIGHRAWLQVGGERLIFDAMQAAADGAFRIGDRLDEVIGATDAHAFLVAVMQLACDALRRGLPGALVADETRMLLAQHVRLRTSEFDLLTEHASYCHALAQGVSDGLAHGAERSCKAAAELAARAKAWERKADHLVMQVREKAERQPRWLPVVRLIEQSDDVADALEEAAFLINLVADHHSKGWDDHVRKVLGRLATTVLQAVQDQVKALAIARSLGGNSPSADNDDFLRATWRVLQAERQCDVFLRDARRVILGTVQDAPSLILANDLAATLELASDRLLVAAYALRDLAFDKAGVRG